MGAHLEEERLRNLHQARRTLQKNQRPLELQKKYTADELAFLRPKLLASAQSGKQEEALDLFERMVQLRAKLAAIELAEIEREELIVEKEQTKHIVEQYCTDCYLLARATDTLLHIS